ncbi:MAG: hypothetical protein KAJ19_16295 [Gammaproteobacteria bacterium]|nr:hypothetical protein [Gammaproteobacteria bacterium]
MTTGGAGNLDVVMTLHGSEQSTRRLGGFTAAVKQNQTAVSDLASGGLYLGASMLAMGAAMKSSSNEMVQMTGNTLTAVGGVMAFVGSTTMFIFSVSKMVESLKQLALWQTITAALGGPAGWAKLAIGAAVVGAGVYGISRLTRDSAGPAQTPTTGPAGQVTVNVAGSVVTEKRLVDSVQAGLAKKGDRNAGRVID